MASAPPRRLFMRAGVLFGLWLTVGALGCRMAHDHEREQPMGPSTAMSGGATGEPSSASSASADAGVRTRAADAGPEAGHTEHE
jgi:hypothetical protein